MHDQVAALQSGQGVMQARVAVLEGSAPIADATAMHDAQGERTAIPPEPVCRALRADPPESKPSKGSPWECAPGKAPASHSYRVTPRRGEKNRSRSFHTACMSETLTLNALVDGETREQYGRDRKAGQPIEGFNRTYRSPLHAGGGQVR